MPKNAEMPVYQKIAIDLASKIANGIYAEKSVIKGSSVLSSIYRVSPETIRRALKVLEDIDIVQVVNGKGVIVHSASNAKKLVERFQGIDVLSTHQQKLNSLLEQKSTLDRQLKKEIQEIIDYTTRFSSPLSFHPMEFKITNSSPYLGKTPAEIRFWQQTGGTIIGFKRNGEIFLSPGPYFEFQENDVLLIIGNETTLQAVEDFLSKKNHTL